MTGLFNTTGHETESETEFAASRLFEGLATVNTMLSRVEIGDVGAADLERQRAVGLLESVAPEFQRLADLANDRPLRLSAPDSADLSIETSEIRDDLRGYGISSLLRNRDLFRVAAREIRVLVEVVRHATFTGRHADWYPVRDVVYQMNRLTGIGVVFSRIASLNGRDPMLEE
jgi:hypothetical protein